MELLIITAVRVFEKDIKTLLKKAGVKSFSFMDVTGYKDPEEPSTSTSWFATNVGERQSILFYAFVAKTSMDGVMVQIKKLNESQQTHSKIHVAAMDISRMNNL
ncbi:hypothetical protein ACV07N_12825 [Roseivirga echinicomitans]